jgi:hypothetical protein
MIPRFPHTLVAGLTAGIFATALVHADQDVPAVDVNKMLRDLHGLQEQQVKDSKAIKQSAIQKLSAAANSVAAGVALWEEAIQATQMAGAGKEASTFRAWKDAEGELYKEREVQNAIHLHLEWLVITLQRSAGATTKDLLPTILNYTKELAADQGMMEALDDAITKEKAQPAGVAARPKGGARREDPAKADEAIRRTHNEILRTPLTGSMIVQWMKLTDYVNVDQWEPTPGSFDGIYKNVVQPELRQEKDARVFEYWDYKLRKEADVASKSKLTFEVDKFNTVRRPALLWNRAQEYAFLGQKNRSLTEMFTLIKTYPNHPDASDWMTALQGVLAPAPAAPSPGTATAAPAFVPAPVAPVAPAAQAPAAPAAPLPPGVSPATAGLPGAQ